MTFLREELVEELDSLHAQEDYGGGSPTSTPHPPPGVLVPLVGRVTWGCFLCKHKGTSFLRYEEEGSWMAKGVGVNFAKVEQAGLDYAWAEPNDWAGHFMFLAIETFNILLVARSELSQRKAKTKMNKERRGPTKKGKERISSKWIRRKLGNKMLRPIPRSNSRSLSIRLSPK